MPLQALEQFEKRIKHFEQMIGENIEKRVRLFEAGFERKIERPLRRFERKIGQNIEKRVKLFEEHFEQKVELPFRKRVKLFEQHFEQKVEEPVRRTRQKIGRNIEIQIRRFEEKNGIRLDDEVRFIGSWIKKPLAVGAVTPSSKPLARAMAQYVDPDATGPVIELGPGTGPITEALVEHGVDPSRLVLVEFNPAFCQLLRERFPEATVVQGDAYRLRDTLAQYTRHGVSAVVSGLPLMAKPLRMRMRLLREALALLAPNAPFVQFTYAVVPPIPKLAGVTVEASERIWRNMPPARVWVYRHG
jgi:phosphatidylethanolamine/phosphatidyl-N-methylethanolamine N-methyltransferase